MGISFPGPATLETDPKFIINEDDHCYLHPDSIIDTSNMTSIKKNDEVIYEHKELGIIKGKVIGFNPFGQEGRVIYIQTSEKYFIWFDVITSDGDLYKKEVA